MNINKSPRRIDRKAGKRNKKVIMIRSYRNTKITKPPYSSPYYLQEIEKKKHKNKSKKNEKLIIL